jgi:hypothetical protein
MTFERRVGREMAITAEQLRGAPGPGAWPTFGQPHSLRCDTGRSALQIALLDWMRGRSSQGVCWLPSYVCPEVVAAIAAVGLTATIYPDRPGLPTWTAAPTPAAADIVVVIHYFGVINQAACAWIDSRADREWGLIEDCVQAPYSAGAGARGDYAVTSLRKWWPAPDGAVVSSRKPLTAPRLSPPDEHFISQRLSAKLISGQPECGATYLKWVDESERLLDRAEPRQVSWISRHLLAAVDPQSAAATRRDNWRVLLEGLRTHERVQAVFGALTNGEVPLGFPVLVGAGLRDRLRSFLLGRQVFCPVHWKLTGAPFAEDRAMSDQMLTIPLDHRYGTGDMQAVLGHIREFLHAHDER